MSEINVIKSTGMIEKYDLDKIKEDIRNAFKDSNVKIEENIIDIAIQNLFIYENISTSEIKQQIEDILMLINKKVAKEYVKNHFQKNELSKKMSFIDLYIQASNPATGSKYDQNANVSHKNIVTMGQELYKDNIIKQNRYMMYNAIKDSFSKKIADNYLSDLNNHIIYRHDETAIPGMPYCVAITMYPFLIDGLTKLGGISKAPTNLKSFCGEFINLVYSISSQFAGAVATPEFLMYMDYFIRKDYGENWTDRIFENVEGNKTLDYVLNNYFQQIIHSMNMPAGNRGYQTVFWNVGYFDKFYFEGIFKDFVFPDGDKPNWDTLNFLQKKFMNWFNEERNKYTLTFPVETIAMLTDDKDVLDKEYGEFVSEMWSKGHSFFCYLSDSPDSLSSCCRVRNSILDVDNSHNHNTHQFSMGTASVATGSKSVMTININRVIQNTVKNNLTNIDKSHKFYTNNKEFILNKIKEDITSVVERVQKYQIAFNNIIKKFIKANMLDVYSAGFINMNKQYLTIGVNGLTDAAEFFGIETNYNEDYKEFVNNILETINICNKKAKTKELMFNTEFVPGENLSIKNYNWDKNDGYFVSDKHIAYSSYFFNPEDEQLTVIEKFKLHGKDFVKYLDGGSACHVNLNEHLTKTQYRNLLKEAVKNGTNYFTYNVKNTVCNECGFISKDTLEECPKCNSKNLDYLTRIIGYLKRVSSFSEVRQTEESMRNYNKDI